MYVVYVIVSIIDRLFSVCCLELSYVCDVLCINLFHRMVLCMCIMLLQLICIYVTLMSLCICMLIYLCNDVVYVYGIML